MENNSIAEGKTTAIISYLTFLGTIIAIFMNLEPKNEFARFHTRQALGIQISLILLTALGSSSIYALYGFYIFIMLMWIYSFSGAVSGVKRCLPVIGPYFQKWFTFIQ